MSAVALAGPEELRLWNDVEPEVGEGDGAVAVVEALAPAEATEATLPAPEPADLMAGGATLAELIAGAWDALGEGEPTACPCCGTALRPRWSAGAGVVGGHCGGCGAELG